MHHGDLVGFIPNIEASKASLHLANHKLWRRHDGDYRITLDYEVSIFPEQTIDLVSIALDRANASNLPEVPAEIVATLEKIQFGQPANYLDLAQQVLKP